MKIVQITAVLIEEDYHVLYALDEEGVIWQNWISHERGAGEWVEFTGPPETVPL
jgi:hypothetical protein